MSVGSEKATGSGPNKKLAKRAAAENLLQAMGYIRPTPTPTKPAIKAASPQLTAAAAGDAATVDKSKRVSQESRLAS